MTAADEAKQLDSVTDVVQDRELDASKAAEAMSALAHQSDANTSEASQTVAVNKEDVDLIVEQLEVSMEEAERALREVKEEDGKTAVFLALKKLVTC